MNRKRPSSYSASKLRDMLEVINIINNIKDNSYNQSYYNNFNNMSGKEKVENIIRNMHSNQDKASRQNAEIFVDILNNLDMLNRNQYGKYNKASNMQRKSNFDGNDWVSKIKFFLNSLNGED